MEATGRYMDIIKVAKSPAIPPQAVGPTPTPFHNIRWSKTPQRNLIPCKNFDLNSYHSKVLNLILTDVMQSWS